MPRSAASRLAAPLCIALLAASPGPAHAQESLANWRIAYGSENPAMLVLWPGEALAETPCPIARDAPGAISTEFFRRSPDGPWRPGALAAADDGETLVRTRLRQPLPWVLVDLQGKARIFTLVEAIAMTGRQRDGEEPPYVFGACRLYATRPPTDRPEDLRERGHWPSLGPRRKTWLLHAGPLARTPRVRPVAEPTAYGRDGAGGLPAPPAPALAVLDLPAVRARLGAEPEAALAALRMAKAQPFEAAVAPQRGPEPLWNILWYGQRSERKLSPWIVEILGDSVWGLFRPANEGAGEGVAPLHFDVWSGNITEIPYGARILAVADLDGNGVDELILENAFWEGRSTDIATWRDGEFLLAYIGGYEER